MHTCLSTYRRATGWHPPLPTELDSRNTLVLAFGAGGFIEDAAPFFELADAFPQAVHAGCSSAGECTGHAPLEDHITVAVVRFHHTQVCGATVGVRRPQDSTVMGAALAAQLPHAGLRMVLLLSESQGVDGQALLVGLSGGLPRATRITGGLAGDRAATATTWVYGADGRLPAPARACAIGLYGVPLRIGQAHAGGWTGLGPGHRVTRSRGHVLHELDGEPALAVYKARLGAEAAALPAAALLHPLAVTDTLGGPPAICSVVAVDEARGALLLGGTLPDLCSVRVMRAEAADLLGSTARAARQALDGLPDDSRTLLLSIGCLARRIAIGDAQHGRLGAWASDAHAELPEVGFYSFGELGPGRRAGEARLHHQTHAFTALSEA